MPFLLPKKETGSAAYVGVLGVSVPAPVLPADPAAPVQPLRADLPPCLCQGPPERRFRDHDNIETNMVADAVALYTMEDDGPRVCSHFACTALGDPEHTEVYVVPEEGLPPVADVGKIHAGGGGGAAGKVPESGPKKIGQKWA